MEKPNFFPNSFHSSLEKIYLSKNISIIESNAFGNCEKLIIYCEQESQPDKWHEWWNIDKRVVYWNVSPNNYT